MTMSRASGKIIPHAFPCIPPGEVAGLINIELGKRIQKAAQPYKQVSPGFEEPGLHISY